MASSFEETFDFTVSIVELILSFTSVHFWETVLLMFSAASETLLLMLSQASVTFSLTLLTASVTFSFRLFHASTTFSLTSFAQAQISSQF